MKFFKSFVVLVWLLAAASYASTSESTTDAVPVYYYAVPSQSQGEPQSAPQVVPQASVQVPPYGTSSQYAVAPQGNYGKPFVFPENPADSAEYYSKLSELNLEKSAKLNKTGNVLIGVGSGLTVVGVTMIVVGFSGFVDACEENEYGEQECDDALGPFFTYFAGIFCTGIGVAGIGTGVGLKIYGGTRESKAKVWKLRSEQFAQRANNQVFLHIAPTFDPYRGRAGVLGYLDF